MTSNIGRIVAGIILVCQAVVAYLLAQPNGTFQDGVTLVLGAISVALTTLALYLKVQLPGQTPPA